MDAATSNVLRRATPTPKLETKISDGRLVFPTAEEAACPWLLCTRIVNLVLDVGRRLGAVMHASLEEQMTDKMYSLMNRYIFEALPRSTKLRPLVPEFSHYTYVVTPVQHVDLCTAVLKLFPEEQRCCPADFGLGEFFGRNNLVGTIWW